MVSNPRNEPTNLSKEWRTPRRRRRKVKEKAEEAKEVAKGMKDAARRVEKQW
ncbi:hypothetical protein HPP92_015897 [Vanilla planifolia]|uniref:Uncharacterized protein n=1 Tax=Vanilla planifolia TaxID=51239 RepID=A0A835QE95_VANPL|nr:hypothetical protein HPP92_016528 [Vanilla planifolia]KAG0471351.1 hypothetical protein HPP92_015897 [Vanilla planifolia]